MASIKGFKKTLAAPGDVAGLTALAKTYALSAGFVQTSDDGVTFEFRPVWAEGDTDDMPRWALGYGASPNYRLWAYARCARNAVTYSASLEYCAGYTPTQPYDTEALAGDVVYAVFDGVAGTFWTYHYRPSTQECLAGLAGVILTRVPTDHLQGLAARYGLANIGVSWDRFLYLPYVMDAGDASLMQGRDVGFAAPSLGAGGMIAPNTLPRMAAQVWPTIKYGSDAVFVSGPLKGILAASDGYALEEEMLPGYRALKDGTSRWHALPWPDTLDVL